MLSPTTLPAFQQAIADAGLDGWLLYDFHGLNPIAVGLLRLEGMLTRRVFVLVPRAGVPAAITHAIEQGPWRAWPAGWRKEQYSSWRTLEGLVASLVGGRRVAMEYSPGDGVPYLDRVPAGVLEMVRAAGAEVVPSGELVTRFYATWDADNVASHQRAADAIAAIARSVLRRVGDRARSAAPATELEARGWILDAFAHAGLETVDPPIVAVGANAADPHYDPSPERPRPIREGDVVLVDLWAREPGGVYADQTWMASVGAPTPRAAEVWSAVRDARDAAIAAVRDGVAAGRPLRGGDVDDVARGVITARGLGQFFIHRTGHSIDPRDLHGSGPHLDNLETREERLLVPGVAFSIEPGVYLAGEIGMRSEVNAFIEPGRAVITPTEYQSELLVV
ncbi:MAG: M24 family metallopeptidase [Gemmatimonadaceae bacterium]